VPRSKYRSLGNRLGSLVVTVPARQRACTNSMLTLLATVKMIVGYAACGPSSLNHHPWSPKHMISPVHHTPASECRDDMGRELLRPIACITCEWKTAW